MSKHILGSTSTQHHFRQLAKVVLGQPSLSLRVPQQRDEAISLLTLA
ncbi:MAG: hypothetical protein AAB445_00070 [Patescibacteria group bacterium]